MSQLSKRHSLRRTSLKGEKFVGTCVLCGTPNLGFANMNDECPNQRGVTQDQALIDALLPDPPDQSQDKP